MTSEKPILFSGPMVRAILGGRKTQTRRGVKAPSWSSPEKAGVDFGCPYGATGDRLWVRESFSVYGQPGNPQVFYRADYDEKTDALKYKPSIHMPRWASRITIEVVDVRVERVRDIIPSDAISEGIGVCGRIEDTNAIADFCALWDSINAKRGYSFESNPFVWVIGFRKISVDTKV